MSPSGNPIPAGVPQRLSESRRWSRSCCGRRHCREDEGVDRAGARCAGWVLRRSFAALFHSTPRLLSVLVLGLALGAAAPAQGAVPDHFAVSVSPKPAHVGRPLILKAVAKDANGATITTFSGPAIFIDTAGTLADSDATFARGVATVTTTFDQPLHADAINVFSGDTTGSSAPFDVLGPVASFDVRVPSRSANTSPLTVTAYARDAAGSIVTDYAGRPVW